jgi:hypothetical protein
MIFHLTNLGGLGMLNVEKFVSALRLHSLWLEWTDESKSWIGLSNPCNEQDRDYFDGAKFVNVGDGGKVKFGHSPWALSFWDSSKCKFFAWLILKTKFGGWTI